MSNPLAAYLTRSSKTQRQFASEIGVREATVSAWVKGVIPRPAQMEKIASVTDGDLPVTSWFIAPANPPHPGAAE